MSWFLFLTSGFFTAKGDLVSSILYPQPINFRFYKDAVKFLLFLGVLGKHGPLTLLFASGFLDYDLAKCRFSVENLLYMPSLMFS